MSILLNILTVLLIFISLFLALVVLAQKAKSDGGMGSAMGGGMAEAAWGAETNNVLSNLTIYSAVAFFVIGFALYLGRIYERNHATASGDALPTIAAPAAVKAAPLPGVKTPVPVTAGQPAAATPTTAPKAATPVPAAPAPVQAQPAQPTPKKP